MSKDETVDIDGAKVAALILNRMPREQRARLVESIRASNPESATRIETIMLQELHRSSQAQPSSLESIAEMSDKDVQRLMRQVDSRDIVVTLKSAPRETQERMLQNLSQARKQEVLEELRDLPKLTPQEVEASRSRVVKTIDELYGSNTKAPVQSGRLRSRLA